MVDRPDGELVTAALAGDRAAFGAVYDRYADRVFGLCLSLLHHREDAADAAQDTFVRAAERLGQLRDPTKLRAWLLAIARNESILRSKRRQRTAPGGEEIVVAVDDTAADQLAGAELAALVWAAADGLDERDRVLLELNVRQGLEGAELADAIGVKPDHGYVLAQRMRARVDRSLGALLVARLGRDDCADLARLLADWDGRFSVTVRKRVSRHVSRCDVCERRRAALVSPAALFASIPLVPAPVALRDRVLGRIELISANRVDTAEVTIGDEGARGWSHGFPPPLEMAADGWRRPTAYWSATIAATALVAVLGIALWAGLRGDGGPVDIEVDAVAGSATADTSGGGPPLPALQSDDGAVPVAGSVAGGDPVTSTTATSAIQAVPATAPPPGTPPAPSPPAPDPTPAPSPPAPGPTPPVAAPQATTAPSPAPPAPPGTTTAPPLTASPTPTTAAAPPPTTAAPLPVLVVAPRAVDLGTRSSSTSVRLTNQGPGDAAWTAAPADGRVSVSPSSGSLPAGRTASITVAVDRRALGTGDSLRTSVVFGGGQAPVTLAVTAAGPAPPTTTRGFVVVTTTSTTLAVIGSG